MKSMKCAKSEQGKKELTSKEFSIQSSTPVGQAYKSSSLADLAISQVNSRRIDKLYPFVFVTIYVYGCRYDSV